MKMDRNRYKRFFWEDMENSDSFNELRQIIKLKSQM